MLLYPVSLYEIINLSILQRLKKTKKKNNFVRSHFLQNKFDTDREVAKLLPVVVSTLRRHLLIPSIDFRNSLQFVTLHFTLIILFPRTTIYPRYCGSPFEQPILSNFLLLIVPTISITSNAIYDKHILQHV